MSLLIRLSDQGQLSQVLDVADRRIAKMAFVLAAEVRSVVVADLEAGLGRIETFGEHQPTRLLKAEFLLKPAEGESGGGQCRAHSQGFGRHPRRAGRYRSAGRALPGPDAGIGQQVILVMVLRSRLKQKLGVTLWGPG
ncbi:MAG: hypothetical protein QOI53_332 [Verrucomicrobiota bacterium]|nr:hypothetical protein [Verrucomicrobiota bacterium]